MFKVYGIIMLSWQTSLNRNSIFIYVRLADPHLYFAQLCSPEGQL